jgi:protein phosphatase
MLVEVDDLTFPARVGDCLLLCSDGLTDMLDDPQIERILQEAPTPETAVQRLVHEANQAGGVDNITALLIQLEEGDPPSAPRRAVVTPKVEADAGRSTTDTEGGGGPPEPTGSAEEEPPPPPPRPLSKALTRAAIAPAILVVAFVGLRVYLDTQWYVGESGGRVAVFRGIPAAVAGFELHHVVVETTISAADAEKLALYRDLRDGITANDRADAGAIVDQIRDDLAKAGGSSA